MWCGPHPGFHSRRSRRRGSGHFGDPWGVGEEIERSMEQAHRDQRAAFLRQQRRMRDARSRMRPRRGRRSQRGAYNASACGGAGPWWLWFVFPMVFFVLPAMGQFNPGGFVRMALAPLDPVVGGLAALLGVGEEAAAFILMAAAAINGAALILALRAPARRRRT